ncbi:hypothetical protein BH10BAC6_BH10BAC6_18120 [soil metagenome]
MTAILSLALSFLLNTSVNVPLHLPLQTAIVEYAPHILVDVDAGNVRIESWPYDKVSLTGDVTSPDLNVSFGQQGNTVLVHAKIGHAAITKKATKSMYVLHVPASAVIELFSASGNVTVNGVYGPVALHVDDGLIECDVEHDSIEH